MKLKKGYQFPLVLFSVIVLSIFFILLYFSVPEDDVENESGLDVRMFLAESNMRRSALEFNSIDEDYRLFDETVFNSESKYAYLWVELTNNEIIDKDIVLINRTRNYYTELLLPERLGAVTLYRYGDTVPMSESPFKYDKSAFPLKVPAGEKLSVIIEYHSPVGIVIDPEITNTYSLFERFASERNYKGIICGFFIVLLIINLINIVMLSWHTFYPVVLFIASVFFFYLRQSRILLFLIDPNVYPDWIFPLSIALNIISAVVFVSMLLKDYLKLRYRMMLKITAAVAFLLVVLGISGYPYLSATFLNLLALILLPIGGVGLKGAMKEREWGLLYIALSFIPWVVMALIDILTSFMGIRLRSAESMQALGMIVTMFLLSISLQNLYSVHHKEQIFNMSGELDLAQNELTRQITSVSELSKSVLHQLGTQLRQPLDSILALTSILSSEYAVSEVTSVCRLLSSEAESLRRMVSSEIEKSRGGPGADEDLFSEVPIPRPWIASCICIFDTDPLHASRKAMILRASGYEVRVVADQYQALSLINSGKADVLVIDPTSTGEASFSLCGLVRSEFNLFEVPILMITDYHADFLMKKGYGAGVNDFLTTPFDSSELSARIQSLIKLKKIARHNHDLAKSEKEKNTFLYFLTHNINTPLTLLLNRINELSNCSDEEDMIEIVDDLQAAIHEINDIVQNVLISFRLSDGRHTVRLNEIDIKSVVLAVESDLRSKAAGKNQQLVVNIDPETPMVIGDNSAIRGIIYNLIDNGLKFSPEHSIVSVELTFKDSVFITVKDSGPGIQDFEQVRLFERFQRLSPQPTAGEPSTGLGLYVAYELARMNGGDLFYENGHDGACFVFSLPLVKEHVKNV